MREREEGNEISSAFCLLETCGFVSFSMLRWGGREACACLIKKTKRRVRICPLR